MKLDSNNTAGFIQDVRLKCFKCCLVHYISKQLEASPIVFIFSVKMKMNLHVPSNKRYK